MIGIVPSVSWDKRSAHFFPPGPTLLGGLGRQSRVRFRDFSTGKTESHAPRTLGKHSARSRHTCRESLPLLTVVERKSKIRAHLPVDQMRSTASPSDESVYLEMGERYNFDNFPAICQPCGWCAGCLAKRGITLVSAWGWGR